MILAIGPAAAPEVARLGLTACPRTNLTGPPVTAGISGEPKPFEAAIDVSSAHSSMRSHVWF
nr:hypothetical protein [Mycobacterium pseudoshottsii]